MLCSRKGIARPFFITVDDLRPHSLTPKPPLPRPVPGSPSPATTVETTIAMLRTFFLHECAKLYDEGPDSSSTGVSRFLFSPLIQSMKSLSWTMEQLELPNMHTELTCLRMSHSNLFLTLQLRNTFLISAVTI